MTERLLDACAYGFVKLSIYGTVGAYEIWEDQRCSAGHFDGQSSAYVFFCHGRDLLFQRSVDAPWVAHCSLEEGFTTSVVKTDMRSCGLICFLPDCSIRLKTYCGFMYVI